MAFRAIAGSADAILILRRIFFLHKMGPPEAAFDSHTKRQRLQYYSGVNPGFAGLPHVPAMAARTGVEPVYQP